MSFLAQVFCPICKMYLGLANALTGEVLATLPHLPGCAYAEQEDADA